MDERERHREEDSKMNIEREDREIMIGGWEGREMMERNTDCEWNIETELNYKSSTNKHINNIFYYPISLYFCHVSNRIVTNLIPVQDAGVQVGDETGRELSLRIVAVHGQTDGHHQHLVLVVTQVQLAQQVLKKTRGKTCER